MSSSTFRRGTSRKTEPEEPDFRKILHEELDQAWETLDVVWKKVGIDANTFKKRRGTLLRFVKELLKDMVDEETGKMNDMEQEVTEMIKEIVQLLKDLTLDNSQLTEAKSRVGDKSLTEALSVYEELVKNLRAQKAVRMDKYHKVNDKVIELSVEMGEEPFAIQFEGIPSDAQVGQLEQKVKHLQKEKLRRQNHFKSLKKSIYVLLQCTEMMPRNELERMISSESNEVSKDSSIILLSLNNLNEMEELEISLKDEVRVNCNEAERLWQKIRELWSRLTIEEEVQSAFEKVHKGVKCVVGEAPEIVYKPTVLRGLQSELKRLEEEKRKNMALFIGQVREELTTLWVGKCYLENVDCRFSLKNYSELTPFTEDDFSSEIYTEELLEKHEHEVEYWRSFVERNKKIIDKVREREEKFAQYRELDQRSDDPARLSNRGGALLKEQKERRLLEKRLPILEKELKQLNEKFEEDRDAGNGMATFLIYGQEINSLIENDWLNFKEEQNQRKESRKKEAPGALGRTVNNITQLGTRGAKRPATPGTNSTPKRARMPSSASTPGRTFATPSITVGSIKKPLPSSTKVNPSTSVNYTNYKPVGEKYARRYFESNVVGKPVTRSQSAVAVTTLSRARKLVRKSIGKGRRHFKGASLMSTTQSSNSSSKASNSKEGQGQRGSTQNRNRKETGVEGEQNSNSLEHVSLTVDSLDFAALSGRPDLNRNPNVIVTFIGKNREYDHDENEENVDVDDANFARPSAKRKFATPVSHLGNKNKAEAGGSKIPSRAAAGAGRPPTATVNAKEQIDPVLPQKLGADLVSPSNSYSDFTNHLLSQSALNSSAVSVVIQSGRKPLSTFPSAIPEASATTTTNTIKTPRKPESGKDSGPPKRNLSNEWAEANVNNNQNIQNPADDSWS